MAYSIHCVRNVVMDCNILNQERELDTFTLSASFVRFRLTMRLHSSIKIDLVSRYFEIVGSYKELSCLHFARNILLLHGGAAVFHKIIEQK